VAQRQSGVSLPLPPLGENRLARRSPMALCGPAAPHWGHFAKDVDPDAARPGTRWPGATHGVCASAPRVEYALTPLGKTLGEPLAALIRCRGKEGCCVVVEAGLAGRSGAQKQAIMAEPGQMEGKNVRTLKRDVGCHNGCTSDQDRAKPGRAHAFQKSLA
jgi:hypothetical protein